MKLSKRIRTLFHCLRYTPLHPQWFAYRSERKRHMSISRAVKGRILDIGCGRQSIAQFISSSCEYISLDYPSTGLLLYESTPNVLADASSLPFEDDIFDTVLLLEVLEHLPSPETAIKEAKRVLSEDGTLIVSTPFLYPIHDAPNDYRRWTKHGLLQLLGITEHSRHVHACGTPPETAALLTSISLASIGLNIIERASIGAVILPFLIIGILLSNVSGWVLSKFCENQHFMPIGYLLVASGSLQENSDTLCPESA